MLRAQHLFFCLFFCRARIVQFMCTTLAYSCSGVAVGSSIGHAVGGWFGDNSGVSTEAQDNGVGSQQVQDGGYQNNSWTQESCEPASKGLTSCLDQNNGNMQICTWYLEQLVSCSFPDPLYH